MTLRLILVRHAKSSWDDPLQSDHDRPLNARGVEAARTMGLWLADYGYHPAEVISSSAARTQQTWKDMSASLPAPKTVRTEKDLYEASPDKMLEVLQSASHSPVLMLGHNPGIAIFAGMLLSSAPLDNDFKRYPSCATLVVEFDAKSRSDVRFGQARYVAFTTPKRIAA